MVKGRKSGSVREFDGKLDVECGGGWRVVICYIGYKREEVKG